MKQLDLICTDCPLKECNEESLWCIYRFCTKPNPAQLEFMGQIKGQKKDRKKYYADYYQNVRKPKNDKSQTSKSSHIDTADTRDGVPVVADNRLD